MRNAPEAQVGTCSRNRSSNKDTPFHSVNQTQRGERKREVPHNGDLFAEVGYFGFRELIAGKFPQPLHRYFCRKKVYISSERQKQTEHAKYYIVWMQ